MRNGVSPRARLTLILLAAMTALLAGRQGPPATTAQAPIVLKIQASWPASLTLFDHLKLVAERVDKLSGGSLKIESELGQGTTVAVYLPAALG